MLATVWQVFNMQHRKLKWCKSAEIDLENSWNHIRWTYFWRGFVIWNLCAGASNLQQQQPQQQQNYNDYSRMSENNCLSPEATEDEPWNFDGDGSRKRQISLVSICIVSHFEFFSNFKECALALRRLIDTCGRPGWLKKKSSNHQRYRRRPHRHQYDPWQLLFSTGNGNTTDLTSRSNRSLRSFMKYISDIENWINRLLEAPTPKEMEACVELEVFPQNSLVLTFALPDKNRLSMCDFPLHLPLELLGVTRCLQASNYSGARPTCPKLLSLLFINRAGWKHTKRNIYIHK